jgi:GH15 family glucan-1,4-alpha-glucosidase
MTDARQFPKISEYGLIGDARTAALVSKYGSIDWCCLPHFDSPSFFAAILDRDHGGYFSISPVNRSTSEQRYLEDTNVLETTFQTDAGSVRILDFFSVTTEQGKRRQLWPDHEILRIVEGLSGDVLLRMSFVPRPEYGKHMVALENRGALGIACSCHEKQLLLRTSLPTAQINIRNTESNAEAIAEFRVTAGASEQFSAVYADDAPAVIPALGDSARERMQETIRYWKEWISRCTYNGEYAEHVRRSALALKLLTFAPSGALIAAPTTSLPERVGGIRNWDYRFCWLRDAAFTVRALVELGYHDEAHAFVSWSLYTTWLTRPKVQVLYSIYGESSLKEKALDWLSGYRDSKPVRAGNAAEKQFQLDVYGEVLDAVHYISPYIGEFDGETRNFIIGLGKAVCELWNQPDDGIWEIRSRRVHHTHSKVLAWVALDRVIRLAARYSWKAPLDRFADIKGRIRNQIETHGFNVQIGAYTRTFDGSELDASVLVMPIVRYCDAGTPRMQSTCNTIRERLSQNGLIFRYRDVDDGVRGPEGSFGICNFWLAEVLARAGKHEEAKHYFEQILKRGNAVGLWSEEIDPNTDEYLGNYPQAFTHIGLINAALALTETKEGVRAA